MLDLDQSTASRQVVVGVCRAAGYLALPVLLVPLDVAAKQSASAVSGAIGSQLLICLIVIGEHAGPLAVPNDLQTLPTVIVDRTDADPISAQVRIDYPASVARLVRYLQELGHRRISYLGRCGVVDLPDRWQRALVRELIAADLFNPEYFVLETPDAAGGRAGSPSVRPSGAPHSCRLRQRPHGNGSLPRGR